MAFTPSYVSPGLASPHLTSPRLASTPADAPMNGLKLPRTLSTPGPYTLRLYMTFHSDTVKGDVAITSATLLSAIAIGTTIPYPSQIRDAALSPADTVRDSFERTHSIPI